MVAHGPWRVLWFDKVEQGMTYHGGGGEDGGGSGEGESDGAGEGDGAAAATGGDASLQQAGCNCLQPAVVGFDYQRTMVAAAAALLGLFTLPPQQQPPPPVPPPPPHCLLVGLGAGSCAAALHHYGTAVERRHAQKERSLLRS